MDTKFYRIVKISRFFLLFCLLLIVSCRAQENSEKPAQTTPDEQAQKKNMLLEQKKPVSVTKKALNVIKYELQGTSVKFIEFDGDVVWIGTSTRGVLKFDTIAKDTTLYDYDNGLISNGIYSVVKGPKGNMWIGTYGGGLSRFDGKRWSNFNTQHGLLDSFVYETLFDQNNIMWIATWSGLNKITGSIENPDSWEQLTKENTNGGLSDDWIYAIELARNGNLWFGTEFGLSFFDGSNWKNWNNKDGLGGDPALLKEENKEYITNAFRGGHHKNQADYTGMADMDINTFNPNHITAMYLDNDTGLLWLGTWGGGLSRFDGSKFITFTLKDGLASNFILSIDKGPDGNIWFGTDHGVNRLKSNRFELYTSEDGLLTDFSMLVKFDDKGRLWVGGPGGLSLVTNIKSL